MTFAKFTDELIFTFSLMAYKTLYCHCKAIGNTNNRTCAQKPQIVVTNQNY